MTEFGQDEDSFHPQLGPIVIVPDEAGDLLLPKFGAESGGGACRFESDSFFGFPVDEVFERRNDQVTRIPRGSAGL